MNRGSNTNFDNEEKAKAEEMLKEGRRIQLADIIGREDKQRREASNSESQSSTSTSQSSTSTNQSSTSKSPKM